MVLGKFCLGFSFLTFLAIASIGTALAVPYDEETIPFKRFTTGVMEVLFYQRMIGEATVEDDYLAYQFDRKTGNLICVRSHWRSDLPESLPPNLLTQKQAQDIVKGTVTFSKLYYVSPESRVFECKIPPENPVWVTRSITDSGPVVTLVDAVSGKISGRGVPPPSTGFCLTGPFRCPANGAWTRWYENAKEWFEEMGYLSLGLVWPDEEDIRQAIQSDTTSLLYEISHGNPFSFLYNCDGESWRSVQSFEVKSWLRGYAKVPFVFLASCGALCDTGDSSLSFAFRKGSIESTATIGYCHMDQDSCSDCWSYALDWQDAFFGYLNSGLSIKNAFDLANADYPMCGYYGCIRFVGDEDFAIVPQVERDPWPPTVILEKPNGGEVLLWGDTLDITWHSSDNARIDNFCLMLSTDGGLTFNDTLGVICGVDSEFVWIVPQIETDQGRIKITALDGAGNEGYDTSDGDFTICADRGGVSREFQSAEQVSLEPLCDPFSGDLMSIRVGLPKSATVCISIYDVRGRQIAKLFDGRMSIGYHILNLDYDRSTEAGVLFLRLTSAVGNATAKLVKVK